MKASTKSSACARSRSACRPSSDTATYAPTFTTRLQKSAWLVSSGPRTPKSATGFSSATPHGPASTNDNGSQPDLANAGSTRVYAQTAKPSVRPASAPSRVPRFQYMPPSIAGANCATAANEISPIATSAYASPAIR